MIDGEHPLRALIVGGEAFFTRLADELLAALGADTAIYNEYGPTEAVVGCMIHRYDPDADPGPEVPIGHPAPGVGLHVLDSVGHPVPLGAEGELFIGRPGMASGYLGQPELTATKFLPNNHADRAVAVSHGRSCADARRRPHDLPGTARHPDQDSWNSYRGG